MELSLFGEDQEVVDECLEVLGIAVFVLGR